MSQENTLKKTFSLPENKITNSKDFDGFISSFNVPNLPEEDVEKIVGCLAKSLQRKFLRMVKKAKEGDEKRKKGKKYREQTKGVVKEFKKNNPTEDKINFSIFGADEALRNLASKFSKEDVEKVKQDIERLKTQNPKSFKGVDVKYRPKIGYTLKTNGVNHRLKFRTHFGYDHKSKTIFIYSINKRDENTYNKR